MSAGSYKKLTQMKINNESYDLQDLALTLEVSALSARVDELKDRVDSIDGPALQIISFVNNVNTFLLGTTVDTITFTWNFSKLPTAVEFNGVDMPAAITGSTVLTDQSITSTQSWTLEASDASGTQVSARSSVAVANNIYYGAGTTFDVSTLTKTLTNNPAMTFEATAAAGEYIWFAIPTRLGLGCYFYADGSLLAGGFDIYNSSVSITNEAGGVENYIVYRSDYAALGETIIQVEPYALS